MNPNWYYAKDGQPVGPVDLATITQLYHEGKIAPDCLVWQDGTPDWVPASSVLGRAGNESAQPPAALPTATGKVDLEACVMEGWHAFKEHWGILLVGTLILFVLPLLWNIPFSVADLALGGFPTGGKTPEMTPVRLAVSLLSIVVSLVLQPPLQAGFALLILQSLRGTPDLGTLFVPYKTCWLKLVQAAFLVFLLIVLVVAVPTGLLVYAYLQKQKMLVALLAVLLLALLTYFSFCVIFINPLIADAGYGVIEAFRRSVQAVNRNLLAIFALVAVALVLYIIGLLLCCVGILAAAPLAMAMFMAAYRQILMPQASPPAP